MANENKGKQREGLCYFGTGVCDWNNVKKIQCSIKYFQKCFHINKFSDAEVKNYCV